MKKLPFNGAQSWKDKVLDADRIWAQVKGALVADGLDLPKTPRRPDVRLIVNNQSGMDRVFRNPGDHSSKAEHIPASGDETAAMVMVHGDTLAEQYRNAQTLAAWFNLGSQGLSEAFVAALISGDVVDLVKEAYGPAPFAGQAKKLVQVVWNNADGSVTTIDPIHDSACAFGARAADNETAFLSEIVIFVQGTTTTPELVENAGMVIAVSSDWQTQVESTRPIVPSVAKEFYGQHYRNIPTVLVNTEGLVQSIDLKNGTVIDLSPPQQGAAYRMDNKPG